MVLGKVAASMVAVVGLSLVQPVVPAAAVEPGGEVSYLGGIVGVQIDGAEAARGFQIGLCQQDCFDDRGSIVAPAVGSDGTPLAQRVRAGEEDYEFAWPSTGTYHVALSVDGSEHGYLVDTGDGFHRLVTDRAAATAISLGSCAQSCRGRDFYVRIGRDPLPPVRATYGVTMTVYNDVHFGGFEFTVRRASRTTRVRVQVVGCHGRVVASRTVSRPARARYTFDVSPDPRKMGRRWKLVTTITEKGRERDRSVYGRFGRGIKGFSCAGVSRRP